MGLHIPTTNIDSQIYLLVPFDTTVYVNKISLPGLDVQTRTYAPGGALSTIRTSFRWIVHVYANGLLSRVYFGDEGAAADTTGIRQLSYDNLGRVVLDSISYKNHSRYDPIRCITYTYTGSERGCRTMLVEDFKPLRTPYFMHTHTYYPDGRVKTQVLHMPAASGDTLAQYSIDSFGYTPGVRDYTYLLKYNDRRWAYKSEVRRFNAFGQPDSVVAHWLHNGDSTLARGWATRNDAEGYPLLTYTYDPDSTASGLTAEPAEVEFFYYKEAPAAIGSVKQPRTTVMLYPNPVSSSIRLRSSGIPEGTPVIVVITGIAGQAVHEERFVWKQGDQQIVLGDELPAGVYGLQVHSASGAIWGSGTFVRK